MKKQLIYLNKHIKVYMMLLCLCGSLSGFSQGVSEISGKITDGVSNGPLLGVNVVIENTSTGYVAGGISDVDGNFLVKSLPLGGPYNVTFSYIGYQTVKKTGYTLNLGDRPNIEVILNTGGEELEEIILKADISEFRNSKDLGSSLVVSGKMLDIIPTATRDFQSLSDLSAQTVPNVKGEQFGASIAGVNASGTGFSIDGVSARRQVFGGSADGPAFLISIEAIREFEVATNDYSVKGTRNGGGAIKAVTKSGNNEFYSSAWGYYTADALSQGKRFDNESIGGEFTTSQYGVLLSGPIVKDKLFFLAVYDRYDKSFPQIDKFYQTNLPSNQQNGITTNEVTDIITTLAERNLLQGGLENQTGVFDAKNYTQNVFLRLDYNINDNNTLTGRFSFLDYNKNHETPTTGFDNYSSSYILKQKAYNFVTTNFKGLLNLNTRFDSGASNNLKLSYSYDFRSNQLVGDRYSDLNVLAGNNSGISFGTATWVPEEVESNLIQLVNDYSFNTDSGWYITLGTNTLLNLETDQFPHVTGGRYGFNSIENLQSGEPDYFIKKVPVDGGPVTRGYSYSTFMPSLYGEVEKKLTDKMTLNLGLRWDGYIFPNTVKENPDLEKELGVKTGLGINDLNNFQPRFQLIYDIKDDGTQIFKFGGGAFSSLPTLQPYVFALSETGQDYKTIQYRKGDANWDVNGINGDWFKPVDQQSSSGNYTGDFSTVPTSITLMEENFQMPMTWKFSTSYYRYLNDWFRLGVSGYYSNTLNQAYYKDINIQSVGTSADGREIYDTKTKAFNNVYQFSSADWSGQYLAGTIEASAKLGKDGLASISYTKARQTGGSYYNAGDGRENGKGIGYSYNDYSKYNSSYNDGYAPNQKIVVSFATPSYKGFVLSGSIVTGQFTRFSAFAGGNPNGIANAGSSKSGTTGGDLAYIPSGTGNNLPSWTNQNSQDYQQLLLRTSPQFRNYLNANAGQFAELNGGLQPWFTTTNFSIKKRFTFDKHNISLRVDAFNIINLLNYKLGYNYEISNTNIYTVNNAANTIQINKDAGTLSRIVDANNLGRVQFSVKYEF